MLLSVFFVVAGKDDVDNKTSTPFFTVEVVDSYLENKCLGEIADEFAGLPNTNTGMFLCLSAVLLLCLIFCGFFRTMSRGYIRL